MLNHNDYRKFGNAIGYFNPIYLIIILIYYIIIKIIEKNEKKIYKKK